MKLLIFILINLFSFTTFASANLSEMIQEQINQLDPNLNIGIKITNLDKDKVVFEQNADRYFIPASTLKFITIVSLIEHFGLDYKFTNRVFSIGKDYYLDIHDPEFTNRELDSMISAIAKYSGGKVDGDIYISDGSFTVPAIMREKTYSDTIYCNGGPITKTHINKNCSKLNVGSSQIGRPIKVIIPKSFPYMVENKAVTVGKNELDRLHVDIQGKKYIIDGTLSIATGKVVIGAVANDNLLQVKHYLNKRLARHNIKFNGKILYSEAKKGAKEIFSSSKTMQEVASVAMKQSDNFITDYLLAEFATQKNQHEWRRAANSLKQLVMQKFNVDLVKASIQDGSGISRLNLITINQYDNFLKSAANSKNFTKIKNIMASPGKDGTLQERFKNMHNIYAKTGSLSNVSGLVGYFYNKNNELHSFAILANNFYGHSAPYRKLEEDIIKLVAD